MTTKNPRPIATARAKGELNGSRASAPEPGGLPKATDVVGTCDVEVTTTEPLVIKTVNTVGAADIVGMAEALIDGPASSAEYVLVPRSSVAICPTEAGTDVLKIYEGVAGERVARRKFGTVVAIVANAEEKNDDTSVAFSSIVVTLLMGYSPIIGDSLSSIP